MGSPDAVTAWQRRDNPDLSPLRIFAAVALPAGWICLTIPLLFDLPVEPFVLLTLVVGLVVPALVLTRRDPDGSVRALLRDLIRLPRPWFLLLIALALIPGLTWVAAMVGGVDEEVTTGIVVTFLSSLLIVNLWEEMAWTGFMQRRAMARWGLVAGSVVTALLFAGIHLPLAFDGAEDASEVLFNVAVLVGSALGLRLLIGVADTAGGRSLLTVAVLHASFNSASEFVDSDSDWIRYAVTLALGLIVLALPVARVSGAGQRAS